MALENATYLSGLVQTNPVSNDIKGEGDDHLRLIKKTLQNSFPNLSGPLNRLNLKAANYTAIATDNYSMFSCSAGMTLNLTAAATLGNGFMIGIHADGSDFIIDPAGSELINGAATLTMPEDSWGYLFCNGTSFSVIRTVPLTMESIYPVGSVYINASVATNPATLLGFGTWEAFGIGRCMVGLDAANTLMDTIGETFGTADAVNVAHTHGVTDPGHFHSSGPYNITGNTNAQGSGAGPRWSAATDVWGTIAAQSDTKTTGLTVSSAGVTGVNQNYQPSITVYMWKRTA